MILLFIVYKYSVQIETKVYYIDIVTIQRKIKEKKKKRKKNIVLTNWHRKI